MNGFGVQGDEGGDKRPPVADDHALADQAVGANLIFEDRRRDILAARRDQNFLFSAGDSDKAVVIDFADVPRMEPFTTESRICRGIIAPITAENLPTTEK